MQRPEATKTVKQNFTQLSLHKSYKECFDSIEEMWEECYYMEDDYAKKPKATTEINEIQDWSGVTLDDTQKHEFQAEVNAVYQHYRRYPPLNNQFGFHRPPGNRFPGNKFQQSRNGQPGGNRFNMPRQYSLRHQKTMLANQVYTFNRTTIHPSVSYTPGSFSMGPMNQNWGHQFSANP